MLDRAVLVELSVRGGSIERSIDHHRVGGASHDPQRADGVQLVGILHTMDAQNEHWWVCAGISTYQCSSRHVSCQGVCCPAAIRLTSLLYDTFSIIFEIWPAWSEDTISWCLSKNTASVERSSPWAYFALRKSGRRLLSTPKTLKKLAHRDHGTMPQAQGRTCR